jgi:hypothetical protein
VRIRGCVWGGDIEPDTESVEDIVPAGLVWCAGVIPPVGSGGTGRPGGDRPS